MEDVPKLIRSGVCDTDRRIRSHVSRADVELLTIMSDVVKARFFTTTERARFLIARELKVDEAHDMMRRRMQWERVHLPVRMSDGVRDELAKRKVETTPYVETATGHPIVVVRSGRFDPRARCLDDAVNATISVLESSLNKTGRVCVYYDRSGFDLKRNLDLEYLRHVVRVLSDNYPESLSSVYVYPTNNTFALAWAAIAPLLNKRTRNKVVLPKTVDELVQAIPSSLVGHSS